MNGWFAFCPWVIFSLMLAATLAWNRRLKREICCRREAEKSLRLLTALTEQAADSVVYTDADYKIRYVNRAAEKLFGWRKEELIGKMPDILNAEPNREEIQREIYDTISAGGLYTGESLSRRKDDSVFYCQMRICALYGEDGNICGYMGSQRDVTPRREAEMALQTARDELETKVRRRTAELSGALKRLTEKQTQLIHAGRLSSVGEMATGIAHELSQPLFVIRLCAESMESMAKRAGPVRSEFLKKLDVIIHSVDRATGIIDHVRDFVGVRHSSPEPADPVLPVEKSLLLFKEQFLYHGITLETDYENNLPAVTIDRRRFEQVLVNFLANARYAVDKQSESATENYKKQIKIRVYLEKSGTAVVFEVADNGTGMTDKEKKRCLEPFFTTREAGEGTGLGLSIAHGIIGECAGRLEIEGRPGEGTTMRVLIPVCAEQK